MRKRIKLDTEAKYQLLKEIAFKLRDTLDLDEILNDLLDSLQTIMEYDAAGIFVLSKNVTSSKKNFPSQMIAIAAQRGFETNIPKADEMLTRGKGIVGHVIKTGESCVVPDVSLDPRYIKGRPQARSEITVPIIINDKPSGALDIESDTKGAFDDQDLEILNFFADAASISIEKAMLHKQILEKSDIARQLRIAQEVQSGLLPSAAPIIPGYDLAGLCLPTYAIGGDYYDFIRCNDEVSLVVADVSGDEKFEISLKRSV